MLRLFAEGGGSVVDYEVLVERHLKYNPTLIKIIAQAVEKRIAEAPVPQLRSRNDYYRAIILSTYSGTLKFIEHKMRDLDMLKYLVEIVLDDEETHPTLKHIYTLHSRSQK